MAGDTYTPALVARAATYVDRILKDTKPAEQPTQPAVHRSAVKGGHAMSIVMIRELWDYHHWANGRLLEMTAALGEAEAGRSLGAHWSAPSLREIFVHVYGADRFWLRQWKGEPAGPPGPTYGLEISTLAELRRAWAELVTEQRDFIQTVTEADLGRTFQARGADGVPSPRPFGMMLLHVPNHATHHRSEIATMLTMVNGSPPDTGIHSYYRERTAHPAPHA